MLRFEPGCFVRAIFDFKGETDAELSFSLGDVFNYCDSEPRGWAKGEIKGKRGWFPLSYVEPTKPTTPLSRPPIPEQRPMVPKKPPAPGAISPRDQPLERGSIIAEKKKIASLLDDWLPNRISIHENDTDFSPSKDVSKRQLFLQRIIGPSKHKRPVFNVHLSELQKHGRDIPLVVIQCIAYLSQENRLDTEGIFRVPGNKDRAYKLISEFKDANETVDFSKGPLGSHTVASVLKSFFQQLPEAVVPPVFTQSMLKAYDDTSEKKQRLPFFAEIINRMPSTNSATFKFLLKFLHKTSLKSDENQMTPRNLAIVWGPTTMRPSHTDTASMMTTNENCCHIIEFLIENWPEMTEYLTG